MATDRRDESNRARTVRISERAESNLDRLLTDHRINLTALLEAMFEAPDHTITPEVIERAAQIQAERQRRRRR